jgi:ATP-dependent Lon protease
LRLTRGSETFDVPRRLPVFPLKDVVAFPYVSMPFIVGRARSLAAIEKAWDTDRFVLLVTQRSPEVATPKPADLYRVGVVASLEFAARLPNGTVRVLVEGLAVARITRMVGDKDMLRAAINADPVFEAANDADLSVESPLARRLLLRFEEYAGLNPRLSAETVQIAASAEDAERQAYLIAAHVSQRVPERQRLLECPTLRDLQEALLGALADEIEMLNVGRRIDEQVRGNISRNQREYYLQEQLRAIHRELGQDDGNDVHELEAQIEAAALPEAARTRAIREVRKLSRMPAISPEGTVARNYLDWIVGLPWTKRTDDVLDIAHARTVLDEDHFGLADAKDRILDHVAVLATVGHLEGQILCLVGPPGVGKTSLGRSIARALGRQFVRMSLGGVRDEAEIRGHRRTYIGALPGRILQAMRRAGVVNPVILLDEIDKLANDYRGDPAAALLEVLDPEQNRAFNDHYLELDYDLSQVFFITTANSLGTIPEPLRDRMEILRLPGYLDQEKLAIARQFLFPRQCERHGVDPATLELAPDVLPTIIRYYTREAGVRDLERRLARLTRKVARRRLQRSTTGGNGAVHERLAVGDLKELLGVAPYDPEDLSRVDQVGVATGLAYTSVGGEVLEIEVAVIPGRGRLHLTGALGDVMKESAGAALSYARSRARALGIDPEFSRTRDLHVHIPAGATPKDGPSAGIAIATALISALTGAPIRAAVAMTGEVTLRGRVLPIGGLKEKSVAALRAAKSIVIIPEMNARELEELPQDVRDGLQFRPVRSMDEVLQIALVAAPAIVAVPAVSPPLTTVATAATTQ